MKAKHAPWSPPIVAQSILTMAKQARWRKKIKETTDGAREQSCSDLRSRRGHRRCCRARLRTRAGQDFSHWAPVESGSKDIVAAGGSAKAAHVDAPQERAMDEHLKVGNPSTTGLQKSTPFFGQVGCFGIAPQL